MVFPFGATNTVGSRGGENCGCHGRWVASMVLIIFFQATMESVDITLTLLVTRLTASIRDKDEKYAHDEGYDD